MELSRYVRVLRRHLWMIVACPVVAALVAGIVSFLVPPVYEARVDVVVRPAQLLPSTDPNAPAISSAQILGTYALLMTERPLLSKVIADLGLNITPDELGKEIKVTPDTIATVLHVSVQDTNRVLATNVANTLVADFISEVKQIQLGETQAPNSRTQDNLVIASPAVIPDKPVSPNKSLNVAIAFAAGLLLAIGIAFLLDYMDQSIKNDDELTQRLGLIPIGHLAFVPAGKGKRGELVVLDAHSRASEAFKALRTSLLFTGINRELKTIVVTSAEVGEGKSRTAANLAVVLAEAGYKTLVIDGDFRRTSQHQIFDKNRNIGLSNLIVQDATEDDAITPDDVVPNLWLLTSGPTPSNPSELLGSGRMKELLARLGYYFAYLIIDTPPVNTVTDALIIAAGAGGTLLVVEQGRTTFPSVKRAMQMLDRTGAHTLGVVMNKVRASAGSFSYDYGSYTNPSKTSGKREDEEPSESKGPVKSGSRRGRP